MVVISARKRAVESEPRFSAAAQHNSKASNWADEQSPHDSLRSILPGLPDDVAVICLALVPRKHLPVLGAVCKRWRSFIQSEKFSFVRKKSGMLEEWLYFFRMGFKESRIQWEVMSSGEVKVWRIPPTPGSVNAGFCTVVLGGKLLIIGGFTKGMGLKTATADVHQYDARLNSWSTLAKMNFVRYNFACSEVNGLIYAVGGCGSGGFELMTAEVYDPDKNEWTLIEKLRRPRYCCSACSFGGKLYVMGGFTTFTLGFCSQVDVYSPDDLSWCKLKNGLCDIFKHMVTAHAVLGKKLYCLQWGDLVIFDPADNSWRRVRVPYPRFPAIGIRLGILCNKLLLFPLYDHPNFVTLIYDPAAPPGSEWGRSALRAPSTCLGTVTIEA